MLESGRQEVSGRLRVSMPVLFGRRCVTPILVDLVRQHPKLDLDLNFTDRRVDLVEDGFDLAIRSGPPGDGVGLMTRRIGSQRVVVCAAPSYLAAHGTPRTLEDLASHEAIVYGRTGHRRTWKFPTMEGLGVDDVILKTRLWFDDLEAIADAAVAGLGVASLPCWLIRDRLRAGELVRVLADLPGHVFDIHALWPQAPSLPLRVRLAIDALARQLPDVTEALTELQLAKAG
jgi:DNA-binding transcriptional LysR family regulator